MVQILYNFDCNLKNCGENSDFIEIEHRLLDTVSIFLYIYLCTYNVSNSVHAALFFPFHWLIPLLIQLLTPSSQDVHLLLLLRKASIHNPAYLLVFAFHEILCPGMNREDAEGSSNKCTSLLDKHSVVWYIRTSPSVFEYWCNIKYCMYWILD